MRNDDRHHRSYRIGYRIGRMIGRIAYGASPVAAIDTEPATSEQHHHHDHAERAIPLADCVGLTILHAVPCDDGSAVLILGWPATDELPPLAIAGMTSQRQDAYFGIGIA